MITSRLERRMGNKMKEVCHAPFCINYFFHGKCRWLWKNLPAARAFFSLWFSFQSAKPGRSKGYGGVWICEIPLEAVESWRRATPNNSCKNLFLRVLLERFCWEKESVPGFLCAKDGSLNKSCFIENHLPPILRTIIAKADFHTVLI